MYMSMYMYIVQHNVQGVSTLYVHVDVRVHVYTYMDVYNVYLIHHSQIEMLM